MKKPNSDSVNLAVGWLVCRQAKVKTLIHYLTQKSETHQRETMYSHCRPLGPVWRGRVCANKKCNLED